MYNDLLLDRIVVPAEDEQDARIQELIEEIEELENLLSPEAQELISDLPPRIVSDDVYEELGERDSVGDLSFSLALL